MKVFKLVFSYYNLEVQPNSSKTRREKKKKTIKKETFFFTVRTNIYYYVNEIWIWNRDFVFFFQRFGLFGEVLYIYFFGYPPYDFQCNVHRLDHAIFLPMLCLPKPKT